jgi:large subunit ribosomal protein L25
MAIELNVQERTETGSKASKKLRAEELVPAVLYGAKEASQNLTVNLKEFSKVWHDAGESTVVTLKGINGDKDVLIQNVDVDPIYSQPIHVDLYVVRKDVAVEVDVELIFTGVAPAEKELGGSLIKVMHEMAVSALPKDLPHQVEVDISSLKTFDDQIRVIDIALPTGVTAVTEAEEVVALVQAAKEEESEETSGDVATVEVEKKGKEEASE